MKKIIFATVFCLGFASSVKGQDWNQYQYVRVPEKFDFLKEENQYQLNALTAFLFEKFGFTSLYEEPTPEGVQPCEVLFANVHNESGLFRSRLFVTLEDCQKKVVFTSKTGVSREKDYKVSYQEALRDAFESVEDLQHTYTGEVIIDPVVSAEEREEYEDLSEADSLPAEVIVDPVITSEERAEVEASEKAAGKMEFSGSYQNGAVSYDLEETAVGYDLFRNEKKERFARLIRSGRGDNFLYSSGAVSGNAYFDAQGNLIAEYVDASSGQVITVIYKKLQ